MVRLVRATDRRTCRKEAVDLATKLPRDGSRLNQILLVRLDLSTLETITQTHAADGIIAYPTTGKDMSFCPSLWGGKDWPSASYNPDTKLLYIPANNSMCETLKGKKTELVVGQLWLGAEAGTAKLLPDADHIGE
jgi:hypothetical protein